MKKHLLVLSVLTLSLFCTRVIAQNPIPNPSFEDWTDGNPDHWLTDNSIFGTLVSQVSPGHSGSSAARGDVISLLGYGFPAEMYSVDTSVSFYGFPVSQQYSTFNFWYKFNPVGTAEIIVGVSFTNAMDSVVGGGSAFITGEESSFTQANVPMYWIGTNPAHCLITFFLSDSSGTIQQGSYFIIDDLSFDNQIGVPSIASDTYYLQSPVPNPSSSFTTISFGLPKSTNVDMKIFDLLGRELKVIRDNSTFEGNNLLNLDVQDLSDGTYFLVLTSEFGILQRKFVVAR